MSDLDAVNYKNGQKNNWRARAWNEIRSRTRNPRNATVLYLPGSTDLDRKVAISKGFHGANLIAIERDADVVKVLRGRGVTTIPLPLEEAVHDWPDCPQIDVLIADFQCGFTQCVRNVVDRWISRSVYQGCLLVNMQRGREQGDDNERLKLWQPAKDLLRKLPSSGASLRELETEFGGAKSRALLLTEHIVQDALMYGKEFGIDVSSPEEFGKTIGMKILHSYRSSERGVLMDSLLIQKKRPVGVTLEKLQSYLSPEEREAEANEAKTNKRIIAAALAVRTMRLNGDLRGVA